MIRHLKTEREALLELALLAVYADGVLKAEEDEQIERLMDELGWEQDSGERTAAIELASHHVRAVGESEEAVEKYLEHLKDSLPNQSSRDRAIKLLEDLINADDSVSDQEYQLLRQAMWVLA